MPGDPGVLVVATLVCHHSLHTRLRVQRAPGIPHALDWAEGFWQSSGALASRGVSACLELEPRLCEERSDEAIQLSFLVPMDCFAEPVIGRAFARPFGSQ